MKSSFENYSKIMILISKVSITIICPLNTKDNNLKTVLQFRKN